MKNENTTKYAKMTAQNTSATTMIYAMKTSMTTSMTSLVLAAGIMMTVAPTATAAPQGVSLTDVTAGGSGCPQGSVRGFIDTRSSKLTLNFSNLIAEAGHGAPISEQRKTCSISVNLKAPSGWSYALDSYSISGFVSLGQGVTARQRAETWFQGAGTKSLTGSATFTGSTTQLYKISDNIPDQVLVWSPCNSQRALNARISADVIARSGGYGVLAVDRASGAVTYSYGLRWKQCS